MDNNNRISIPLSKTKLLLLILSSVVFVTLGIIFNLHPEKYLNTVIRSEIFLRVIGIVSALFFGICGITLTIKLFDRRPGLIIDENGIWDNTSGAPIGKIKWNDIQHIRIQELAGQKMIKIVVSNPEYYINKQKSKVKKKMMRASLKEGETPISISTNGLKAELNSLHKTLIESWENYTF